MRQFGDSGPYPQDIPFDLAALYASDCDDPCPEGVAARWKPADRRWITFTGLRSCSIADYELHTEVFQDPARLTTWVKVRHHMKRAAIIYSDLANVASAVEHVKGLPVRWWLAAWQANPPTADELSLELARDYNVIVHPQTIWACQWQQGTTYDTSDLYQDFR